MSDSESEKSVHYMSDEKLSEVINDMEENPDDYMESEKSEDIDEYIDRGLDSDDD